MSIRCRSWKLLVCIVSLLLVACPDSGDDGGGTEADGVGGGGGDGANVTPGDTILVPDTGPSSEVDSGTPGSTADPDATQVGEDAGDHGLQCGGFGEECTSNDDCCSEFCVETFDGFQCTITCLEDCPEGFECKAVLNTFPDVVTVCVPNVSKLCRPCELDLACNGGKCIEIGEGNYCTVDCSVDPCPAGFLCEEADTGALQCVPENGTCDCLEENDGAVRPCGNQNEFGACTGVETCEASVGWGECDASIPAEELCDGVDNDCDGLADEDFKDAKPCEAVNENGTCVGIATCQGGSGWVCSAANPSAEACDFLDNDCDGTIDEDFKTDTGKYGTLHHCGGCDKDCEGLFPNGTAACDESGQVPQCVVDTCDPGYYKPNDYQCLAELNTLCQPCSADFQCGGGVCVTVGAASFCSKPCNGGEVCGAGFVCQAVDLDGTPKGQGCVPLSGTCDCTPATDGQKHPCTAQSPTGECFGFETCDGLVGWGECDAPPPGPELCDGLDNDCNGLVDDDLPASQPCEATWPGVGTCTGDATCFGSAGWVCNAPTPTVELCDYKDNDCDGDVDQPYKDAEGKYATNEHCGACGTNCQNAIPNATALCDTTALTPLCVVDECAPGFFKANDYLCLKEGESHCKLCTGDAQCDGKECVTVGDADFCTETCAQDTDCPEGFACLSTYDPDLGGNGTYCIPQNGTCDCNTDTAGAKKPCQAVNDIGTCVGFHVCDAAIGWDSCSAQEATAEICDGLDNDCNGLIDDGLPDEKPCSQDNEFGSCAGTAKCFGGQGWVCSASTPVAEKCDFQDNDCDDQIDEDFKNEAGKYGSETHCGTCNASCGDNIPNAQSEVCDDSKPKPQCVVSECDDGYFKLNEFQCVDTPDVACLPCGSDSDCYGGACKDFPDGKACVSQCTGDAECPNGFACDGAHCIPLSGSCDCTQATAGVKKFCAVENDFGTCVGFSTCDPGAGWSACDAAQPGEETCDGLDNDCNGVPDDGLPVAKPCEIENEFGLCAGEAVCQGSLAWVCQAKVPTAEVCDFLDNNCNGGVDEDFKDPEGKYAVSGHCGTCNKACGATIANAAQEVCDTSKAVPQCIATGCQPGYFLQNELQCVPNPAVGCSPCVADDTCYGGKCVAVGSGSFCLESCAESGECNAGFTCNDDDLCHPENATCDCSPATAGQKRTCSIANTLGTCLGFETCDPDVGWTGCTAATAEKEDCDGKDNDCNGLIDDGLPNTQVCFNKNTFGVCSGQAICLGSAGWVCQAAVPDAEACDFKDNDCDGDTDEDYKDAAGKYTTLTHCGTCNNGCGDQYPNSLSEICDASKTVPQCIVEECEDGYLKLNDFQCLEIPQVLCEPCSSDANCFGSFCSQVDNGTFCLAECDEGGGCDEGYFCSEGLCRPNNGTCDCTPESAGNKRTCQLSNELGVCFGFETCVPSAGWDNCDAEPPSVEICDGQDNDCDGFIDDGMPASQDCEATNQYGTCDGVATCFGTVGWFCKAPIPAAETCDFKDNDCDGQTDETFKNTDGAYGSDEHCGACNTDCSDSILNAIATCDSTKPVPQCVVEECGTGWEKFNEFLCVPITSTLCEPCATDENCVGEGAKCIDLNDGKRCAIACDHPDDCPEAFDCLDPGVGQPQCVPKTGSCDCDGTNLDLQMGCKVEYTAEGGGPTQLCYGTNFCTEAGWSGCTLPTELCNNLDDNCDGEADEIFKNGAGQYATPEHCGKCNRNCASFSFTNGVGVCNLQLTVPDCEMACLDGFYDVNANPGDGCECEYVSATDHPDGTDHNCDGIDGELDNAIFVAKNGHDDNPGTLDLPKLTVQAGVIAAKADGKRDVYVSTSVYSENVTLAAGVSVYGGYSADFLQRDILLYETAIIGAEPSGTEVGAINAVGINGGGQSTTFDGFTVFGYDEQTPAQSSYAVYVRNCDARLRIRNNRILAGSGGSGSPGLPGEDGDDGDPGGGGGNAKDVGTCTGGAKLANGGTAGERVCGTNTSVNGGAGGAGYCPDYAPNAQNSAEKGSAGANGGGAGGDQGYDGIMAPSGGTGGNVFGCQGQCGGVSNNGCWCDSQCAFYGDCCADACQYCNQGCGGVGEPTPGGGCSIGQGCGSCIIPPNNLPMVGTDGVDGSNGGPGAAGPGCTDSDGTFVNGQWKPATGKPGDPGGHGGGGGGGGAGNGVQTCSCSSYGGSDIGGSGGGGGAAACGSTGGSGGTGGGGSFGIFLFYDQAPVSAPLISDNAIRRGVGGLGGPGGNAGVGGLGGIGGKGGASGTGTTSTFCAGKGGNGGKGGEGGHGGGGGGGCGGASYAIFAAGIGNVNFNAIKNGVGLLPGGAGGSGGPGGLSLKNSGGKGGAGAFEITNF